MAFISLIVLNSVTH